MKNSDSDSGGSETKRKKFQHPGHDLPLDDVMLSKSIDDLRRLNVPVGSFTTNLVHPEVHQAPPQLDGNFNFDSQSRPLSTATNFSVEIGDYQSAIEEVLTKLLAAEEVITKEPGLAASLNDARQQFHEHEEFMLKLADYQVNLINS